MAAVLACGPESVISHRTAAQHWRLQARRAGPIEISAPVAVDRRPRGVLLHRRRSLAPGDRTVHVGIPVTTPIRTLVDIATQLGERQLEAAVNEADKRDLAHPEELRNALDGMTRQPGVGRLRRLLDRRVFRLTDSQLERTFLGLVRSWGLPVPETRRVVNGFRVDFYWRALGLVVETDGLRYHRTPAQQTKDRLRDQAHTAAGLTTIRFTHVQIRYEREEVRQVLNAVIARLAGRRAAA
jgi:very-short-patch-repair endonuclease